DEVFLKYPKKDLILRSATAKPGRVSKDVGSSYSCVALLYLPPHPCPLPVYGERARVRGCARRLAFAGTEVSFQARWEATQAAASNSASSRNRGPTSWMPSGRPLRPVPAGSVRHGIQASVQMP